MLVLQGLPDGSVASVLLRVDARTGDIEGTPLRVGGGALDLLPTRDGRRVFVPSPEDDSTLEIDADSLRVLRRHRVGGFAGALSPDGGALAWIRRRSGSPARSRSGTSVPSERGHGAGVLDMAFTPDGRTLVSSDFDGGVIAWNVARGKVSEELPAHRRPGLGACRLSRRTHAL